MSTRKKNVKPSTNDLSSQKVVISGANGSGGSLKKGDVLYKKEIPMTDNDLSNQKVIGL